MARKTNLQLQQELAEVKARLAAAEAATAEQTEDEVQPDRNPDEEWGEDAFEAGTTIEATPAWATQLLDRLDEQAEEIALLKARKPRKAKSNVGQREGDVTIRNITSRLVRVRLGNNADPYRIELQPQGKTGDVADVPGSLVGTTQFKRNVGRVFEVISSDDAAGILYDNEGGRQFPMATLIQEAERIVARQNIDPNTGLPTEPVRRERGGPVGPRVAAAPGSDNVLTGVPPGTDPEFAAFMAWKASQGTLGAPMGDGSYEPGTSEGVSLLGRLELAARSGDQEAGVMARRLKAAAEKGVIPENELEKPLRVTRSRVTVQPNVIY